MSIKDLGSIRQEINEIDQQLSALFDRRMQITKDVALYKIANHMQVFDREREQQVIERVVSLFPNRDEEFHKALRILYQTMMDLSKENQLRWIQTQDVVGYQGVPGSFSYEALEKFYGNVVKKQNYLTFEEVFEALKKGEIRYGVLPIENSSTGVINEVYDLLGRYQFYIIDEYPLKVEHNLLGLREASMADIKEVYSHPQGFAQSAEFFGEHQDWNLIPYHNTAKSAEYISSLNDPTKACVASRKAAELYGLVVLKDSIQDLKQNFTRFVVISPNMEVSPEADKISLYFTLAHKAGSLAKVMNEAASRGLNLLRIESRPIRGQIWEYSFFMDIEGHADDPNVKEALTGIKNHCLEFKLLGNYKRR